MNSTSLLDFTGKINRAYSALCQPVADQFGITRTAFDILMFLSNNPQYFTAKDICSVRNIKPNVVSLHVDRLVKDGFLTRQSVEGDRRKIRLVCTEKAEPVIRCGKSLQKNFYQELIAGLSNEDLALFKHCFQVIAFNADHLEHTKFQ